MRALVLDHRDSFVFNLTDDLTACGFDCDVVRNDMPLDRLQRLVDQHRPDLLVLSPGPGHPREHGALLPLLRRRPRLPLFGVCLGMQAMVAALGGRIGRADEGPVHGRASRVAHDGDPLFAGLPSGFPAGRYHSLVATELPHELQAIAWTEDRRTLLGVRHRELPWIGLQFHPESILSADGRKLLANLREAKTCSPR